MKSTSTQQSNNSAKTTNSKPIPHIPLPFTEVMADVLKVKPPEKPKTKEALKRRGSS